MRIAKIGHLAMVFLTKEYQARECRNLIRNLVDRYLRWADKWCHFYLPQTSILEILQIYIRCGAGWQEACTSVMMSDWWRTAMKWARGVFVEGLCINTFYFIDKIGYGVAITPRIISKHERLDVSISGFSSCPSPTIVGSSLLLLRLALLLD